jgi:hypothetical protein
MKLPWLLTIMVLLVSLAKPAPAVPQTPPSDAFPNKSITIYVADFDIGATNAPATAGVLPSRTVSSTAGAPAPSGAAAQSSAAPAALSANSSATTASSSDVQASDGARTTASRTETQAAAQSKQETPKSDVPLDDSPRAQAARLIDLTSTVLVQVLEQAGYTVRRLRSSAARPESGVVIHGVFAQADPNAGLRRVVIGGIATDPKMLLFIGIGNLARPDQNLYQVAAPPPASNLGPVISVSAYAPVSRYELEFDPSPEQVKKTAETISTDLTRVLNANPLSVAEQ